MSYKSPVSIVATPRLNMVDGQVHDDERLVFPLELPHHRTARGRGGVLHLLKNVPKKLGDEEHLYFSSRSIILGHTLTCHLA